MSWRKSKKHKGGRPPEEGRERYCSGRVKESVGPTPELLARRAALTGDKEGETGETAGRASGLLRVWKIITRRQEEALERYRRDALAYRQAIGAPPYCAATPHYDQPSGGGNWSDKKAQAAKERMRQLEAAVLAPFKLAGRERLARELLYMICVEDYIPMQWRARAVAPIAIKTLQDVSTALADYYRVPLDLDQAAG